MTNLKTIPKVDLELNGWNYALNSALFDLDLLVLSYTNNTKVSESKKLIYFTVDNILDIIDESQANESERSSIIQLVCDFLPNDIVRDMESSDYFSGLLN